MKRLILLLATIALSQAIAFAQDAPAPQPDPMKGIEIGPKTTVVTGPRNADGTINYISAANELLGKDITPEENAASLLITACERGNTPYQLPESLYQELAAPVTPAGEDRFLFLEKWISKNKPELKTKYSDDERFEWENAARQAPWKRESYPFVAMWLDDEGKFLKIIEQAAARPKYFVPLVSTENPPSMVEALKHRLDVPLTSVRVALLARANERTGEGDFAGALRDMHTLQRLGRLSGQDLDMGQLMAAATFTDAMRGYRILALMGSPDKNTLERLPEELGNEYTTDDMGKVERFYGLDTIMQVARGNEQPWLRLLVWDFSESKLIADDDLHRADWTVVMRSFNNRLDRIEAMLALPRAERRTTAKKMTDEELAAGLPQSIMSDLLTAKQLEPGEHQKLLEKFLQQRIGESHETYSERMAMLFTGDAATALRMANVMQRPIAEQRLTEVSIALARYKMDQGKFPTKLEDLLPTYLKTVPLDPFSDQPLKYRQEANSFTLYSIGLNEVDDGGVMDWKKKADDMVVTAEKGGIQVKKSLAAIEGRQ